MIKLDLRLAALIVSRYKHTYAFHDPILNSKKFAYIQTSSKRQKCCICAAQDLTA